MSFCSEGKAESPMITMRHVLTGGAMLLAILCTCPTQVLAQTTHTVCPSGCDFTTIQSAIDDLGTVDGDTIFVDVGGTHTEYAITVNKSLTIQGRGMDETTVEAAASCEAALDRVFFVFKLSEDLTVTFKDISIKHGKRENGGGIYNDGETVYVQTARVSENCATSEGAGIVNGGTLYVTDSSEINSNQADNYGGGILGLEDAVTEISDTSFHGNVASGWGLFSDYGGGAIYNDEGSLTVADSLFTSNQATAQHGGAVYQYGTSSQGVISRSTFSSNSAEENGGAINNDGDLVIEDCTFSGNTADDGSLGGGAIRNYSGTLEVTGSTFTGNQALWGGAIYMQSNETDHTVTNSTFTGNKGYLAGDTTNGGGGAFCVDGGTVTVTNCTVSGNTAGTAGLGGGFWVDDGGGVTVVLASSILSGNVDTAASDSDCEGPLQSNDYNLIGSDSGCTVSGTTAHNLALGTDPELMVLGNYGGPTQTMALEETSPCLNTIPSGTNGCGTAPLDVDQRGYERPFPSDGECDMGAYERGSSTLVTLASFSAAWKGASIVVAWETASEVDCVGYRVLRSVGHDGPYVRLSGERIPALGSKESGASYEIVDSDVVPGQSYFYKLEDIDSSLRSTYHGPVEAQAPSSTTWNVARSQAATLGVDDSGLSGPLGALITVLCAVVTLLMLRRRIGDSR